MIYRFLPLLLLFFMSFTPRVNSHIKNKYTAKSEIKVGGLKATSENLYMRIQVIYNSLNSNSYPLPQINCFAKAMEGFFALKENGIIQKDILTIIDFSLSSTKKRLWVIDLSTNTILFNSLVAHGMNSGEEFANSFSNSPSSNKSSLGFYATAEVYQGKHGTSLKLDGLEQGINSNARARAVVMHGASYANPSILQSQGYLGRSQGCPAIPENLKNEIINTIKGKSCLFIYHSSSYEISSKLVAQS
jgi:hypothetical protein